MRVFATERNVRGDGVWEAWTQEQRQLNNLMSPFYDFLLQFEHWRGLIQNGRRLCMLRTNQFFRAYSLDTRLISSKGLTLATFCNLNEIWLPDQLCILPYRSRKKMLSNRSNGSSQQLIISGEGLRLYHTLLAPVVELRSSLGSIFFSPTHEPRDGMELLQTVIFLSSGDRMLSKEIRTLVMPQLKIDCTETLPWLHEMNTHHTRTHQRLPIRSAVQRVCFQLRAPSKQPRNTETDSQLTQQNIYSLSPPFYMWYRPAGEALATLVMTVMPDSMIHAG